MSILSTVGKIFGGPLFDKAIDLFGDYQDKKLTKEQLRYELSTLAERNAHDISLAQIDVNIQEAKGNIWQSGWRPAIGWICAGGFATNFLLIPLATIIGKLVGVDLQIEMIDVSTMLPVLLGMLGLGSLRTVDKFNGKAK